MTMQTWVIIFTILESYPGISDEYPINTVWVENSRTNIPYQITIKTLSSGTLSFVQELIRFSHKELVTHSLQSGFSMKIFLSRVYLETILIIGIWSRNYFLWYTYIQAIDPRKDISDLIYGEKTLYTIPKSEVVYYTPVQSRTQSCRINSQRGNTEVLPLATALKWSPK